MADSSITSTCYKHHTRTGIPRLEILSKPRFTYSWSKPKPVIQFHPRRQTPRTLTGGSCARHFATIWHRDAKNETRLHRSLISQRKENEQPDPTKDYVRNGRPTSEYAASAVP